MPDDITIISFFPFFFLSFFLCFCFFFSFFLSFFPKPRAHGIMRDRDNRDSGGWSGVAITDRSNAGDEEEKDEVEEEERRMTKNRMIYMPFIS